MIEMSYIDYYGYDPLGFWKPRTKELEVKILQKTEDTLEFEIDGETHTFLNPLRMELLNIEGVTFVAYKIVHPLVDKARFIIRTDPKKIKPMDALKLAHKKLKDKLTTLVSQIIASLNKGETKPSFLTEEEYRKIRARF